MKTVPTGQRLKKLRTLFSNCLEKGSIDAYIVFSNDKHMNEFTSEVDQRLKFISGFGGSQGIAVITMTQAFLWTNAKYHLEASHVLDENWTLMKEDEGVPTLEEWLGELPLGWQIGTDFHYISHADWEKYSQALSKTSKFFSNVKINLIDIIWKEEGTPKVQYANPTVQGITFAGVTWQDKINLIRMKLKNRKCDLLVLSCLDEIAWLFNMRGFDIPFSPVFFSYAIITLDQSLLFLEKSRISDFIEDHLNIHKTKSGESVIVYPYDSVEEHLKNLSEKSYKMWINPSTPRFLTAYAKKDSICETNPVCLEKSIKNEVELKSIKDALIKEAAVFCEFFGYIDKMLDKLHIDEYSASLKLLEIRSEMEYYIMDTFESIICAGSNSAKIHYKPTFDSSKKITREEVVLVDSGANYLEGTTEITRTLHFGQPNDCEIECYTTVLKSYIAVATAKFPKGTRASQIDTLARAPLWDLGLKRGHGIRHDLKMLLNVHEGCQSVTKRLVDHPLTMGNILSNEPGYYKEGSFGIRLESMVAVVPLSHKCTETDLESLQFETISFIPMHLSLIDKSMLSSYEIEWINSYHAKCAEILTPVLTELNFKDGLEYLKKNTAKI